jgi:uncharacterized membrane protein YbjE (DUF340 family)
MSYSLIISVLLGLLVGYYAKLPQGVVKKTALLQTICLLFMLFFMGINIGVDKDITKNLPSIGLRALVLALASIIGSILLVMSFSKLYNYIKNRKVQI